MNKKTIKEKKSENLTLYRAKRRAIKMLDFEGYKVRKFGKNESDFDIMATRDNEIRMICVRIARDLKTMNYEDILNTLSEAKIPDNAIAELWVWQLKTGFHVFSVKN